MYKFILGLLATTVLVSFAYASGNHGGSHGHDKKPSVTSRHDNKPAEKVHRHSEGRGAIGSPARPSYAKKTVRVSLTNEMKIDFNEALTDIKSGTVIYFMITNEDNIPHTFSIGNQEEQIQLAEVMSKTPSMIQIDGNAVTVAPGKTQFLTWHFEGNDVVVFACHMPGHYEAGMFRKVALRL